MTVTYLGVTAPKTEREQLVGRAVFDECDPHVRASVARNEHPDSAVIKRAAERALRALRARGELPEGIDITVTIVRKTAVGGTERFRLGVRYSPELLAWIDSVPS